MYDVCMIKTAEHLVDPVAYILQNVLTDANAQNFLDAAGFTIVSGADYDVLVQRHKGEALEVGRKDFVVSRLLGNLYTGGNAQGLAYDEDNVELTWYPSPKKANDIAQQLGLVVGRDVLRFVHANNDKVQPTRYRAHLQNGEYPQSVGPTFFAHDRNSDHAVAVLTMPPTTTKYVIDTATSSTDKDVIKADKNMYSGGSIVAQFDHGTSGMHKLAEKLLFGEEGVAGLTVRDGYYLASVYKLLSPNNIVKHKHLHEAKMTALAKYIDYYLDKLAPKIAALQAVTPKLIQIAGIYSPSNSVDSLH